MTSDREQPGITLAEGMTAGQLLLALLETCRSEYPQIFGELALPPEANALKAQISTLLPRFEAARVRSPQACEVARALYSFAAGRLRYADERGERPLVEALTEPAEALPLVRVDLPGAGRLRTPTVDFAGKLYVGTELAELAQELARNYFASRAVIDALEEIAEACARRTDSTHSDAARRTVEQTSTEGSAQARADGLTLLSSHKTPVAPALRDGLSLRGQRFVLLGAGAELSPVYTLLEAGAEVLWLDKLRPPIDRLLEPKLAGSLSYVEGGVDLLQQPAALRATILDFAAGQPVHVGLYAFATGSACPLRLALGMNELVRSLPSAQVASLHFLLSPTSVNRIYEEDAARADERLQNAGKMQRALLRAGQLDSGHLAAGAQRLSRALVSQQGAAYHVAEWVGRRLAAEAFCEFGPTLIGSARQRGFFVAANMAPVSSTRSLASPVMEAALLGAPSFHILIAPASTARSLCALLTVRDVLLAARPSTRAARLDALFAQQFHGGVHAQPFALEGLIRVAAIKGFSQRPKLAFELLR